MSDEDGGDVRTREEHGLCRKRCAWMKKEKAAEGGLGRRKAPKASAEKRRKAQKTVRRKTSQSPGAPAPDKRRKAQVCTTVSHFGMQKSVAKARGTHAEKRRKVNVGPSEPGVANGIFCIRVLRRKRLPQALPQCLRSNARARRHAHVHAPTKKRDMPEHTRRRTVPRTHGPKCVHKPENDAQCRPGRNQGVLQALRAYTGGDPARLTRAH